MTFGLASAALDDNDLDEVAWKQFIRKFDESKPSAPEPLPFIPYLRSYKGSADGIRWGKVMLGPDLMRRYQYDRLTGKLVLWRSVTWSYRTPGEEADVQIDDDPERRDLALRLIQRHEAGVGEPEVVR